MDADRFDTLSRVIFAVGSRRGIGRALAGLVLVGPLPLLHDPIDADARKKRKKRKKKKKCKAGQRKCGKKCIPTTSCCSSAECGGGATCQNGACHCPSGQKDCQGTCVASATCCPACTGGQTCQGGTCRCPAGQDACGGACLETCPLNSARNPDTCGCCRVSGAVCTGGDSCCSALACPPGGGSHSCPGRTLGQPCDFDAQCESGKCNQNLVCA